MVPESIYMLKKKYIALFRLSIVIIIIIILFFIPIYTLLLAPIFMILKSIDIYIPYLSGIFLFLIGMTLAFHFVMTTEILKIQQSDIARSGFIFSMILIFIGNLAIVMAVFSPFFESISFVDFCRGAVTYSGDIYRQLVNKLLQLVQIVGVWQI